jgi:hypothetical protein
MKRERPPMPPLAVRVQVAERQFFLRIYPGGPTPAQRKMIEDFYLAGLNLTERLRWLLLKVFPLVDNEAMTLTIRPCALDHDPALILRPYNPRIKDVASRYTPHAHDPDALIYREKADHQQKTTGRRAGASRTITTKGSDIGLKTKFARLEKPRKPRTTIRPRGFAHATRPWPKRKFRKP